MHNDLKNYTLAILCGGLSTRLGTDKGLFAPLSDESLIKRKLRLFERYFESVNIVVRDSDQAELYSKELEGLLSSRIKIICDSEENRPNASLVGVETAVAASTTEMAVVIPVDQVGVRPLHLSKLCGFKCFEDESDLIAFPSIWAKADLSKIQNFVLNGALSVKGALRELPKDALDVGEYREELAINGNTKEQLQKYFGLPLLDPQKRRLHYLRFSIVEACNLSCNYCLPEGYPEWYKHRAKLNSHQIQTVLEGFKILGFRKVRFTGGEPALHNGCLSSVKAARKIGYEEIAMTTNGLLIKDLQPWIDAGLTSINISLDTLDQKTFTQISKTGDITKVIKLVEEAAALGLNVKINTVLQRTINGSQEQIESLIDWAKDLPITLRFIELMDTKLNSDFSKSERVLGSEILPLIEKRGYVPLQSKTGIDLLGPATDHRDPNGPSRIGFINPISCNFCDACNRLRVTAKGNLRLCLFGDHETEIDLNSPVEVAKTVMQALGSKPKQHYLLDGNMGNVSTFRTIGG